MHPTRFVGRLMQWVPPELIRVIRKTRRTLAGDRPINGVMLVLAALTGFSTGVFAWLLLSLIEFVVHNAWSTPVPWWQILLVPTVGGLIVGTITTYLAPEASGGGVVPTMEALALRGGRFRARVPFVATGAAGISLGTGASGGPEGPMVMVGGAIGSALSRLIPVGEDRTRTLVAAGAAAGIGASFNAPIGGMLFAIELLLGGLRRAGSLQVVVVAAVVGSVTARQLVGEGLTFRPAPGLGLGAPRELLLYAALGMAAVAVAVAFRRSSDLTRRWFTVVRNKVGSVVTVGLAGLGVGVVALAFPQVLGDGSELPSIGGRSDPIQSMLDADFSSGWTAAGLLLALGAAKIVATSLSKGAGASVGLFAPTLFTGAALGGAFGIAASQLFGPEVQPAAFALVGMAAVFAATARAPLTAILIVFELTGSYELVLPLMVAVGIAIAVGELRGLESIYVHELRERGVLYGTAEDLDVLQIVTVGEVMTRDHPTIGQSTPFGDLGAFFASAGSDGFAVVDEQQRLVGMVTRSDLERPGETAGEICTRQVVTVSADDPVFRAVRRMGSLDIGRVPVVDPRTRQVVGMMRRADVVRAYQRGIDRSVGIQQHRQADRLRDLTGVRFVELVLDRDSAAIGRRVADIAWPERTVVTSVRRAGTIVVPTGSTVFEPGDELVVLTGHGDALYAALRQPQQADSDVADDAAADEGQSRSS